MAGLFNRGVRVWDRTPYSHGELIFSDGMSGSSSFVDGGVRLKKIIYSSDRWDFFKVEGKDEATARQWFIDHAGQPYDVAGITGCVIGPIPEDKNKSFCTEAIMAALGYSDPWRFRPGIIPSLYQQIHFSELKK